MIDLLKISNIFIRTPAGNDELNVVEASMNTKLPMAYRKLLLSSNGFSIGGGLLIYGTEEIVERNLIWEVEEYASNHIAVGDDGGGIVFLMAKDVDTNKLYAVDSGDMNLNNATIISSDLLKWISDGCSTVSTVNESNNKNHLQSLAEACDVVLKNAPEGGLKDLVKLKNILSVDIPSRDLLKGSRMPPFTIKKNISYGQALKRFEELGPLSKNLKIVGIM